MKTNTMSYKCKQFMMFAGATTVIFSAVVIVPFLYGVYLTFTSWDGVSTSKPFVGLTNYLSTFSDAAYTLPKDYVFLNYLRCHDDIGWGLDYETLKKEGINERSHKQYLNDFFLGVAGGSCSRGELYNADPVTGDARFCGTTASMCGIEKAGFEQDRDAMERAIQMDVMLHAYMFMLSGIPVLYSGDEIGQVNNYSYRTDPAKAGDSRYIHRGALNWDLTENIGVPDTVQGKLFGRLLGLEEIRKSEKAFMSCADCRIIESGDPAVLCIDRRLEGEKILGLFNFSESGRAVELRETGEYVDLLSGRTMTLNRVHIPAYGFFYLKYTNNA